MGVFQKGNDWYIDYYVYGKRKREKIGPNKRLAARVLGKRRVEVAENKYLDIDHKDKIKFEDLAKVYLETYSKPNKKSSRRDEASIKNLSKYFKGKHLYEIAPLLVEKYKIARKIQVSPATVNREVACLKHMLNKAIEWGKIKENPVLRVKLFRENNKRLRYLEKEEIVKLINVCADHLRPIVILALNTGMRKAELLNLKWQDVDLEREIIYLLNTKNSDTREIPMNNLVKNTLTNIQRHPDSLYVFCNKRGRSFSNVRKSFAAALGLSGIEDFRFHDLRHTFASQLVMAGIDLNTVRELMGHKSIEMTLRYAHLSPDHKKRAVDILCE